MKILSGSGGWDLRKGCACLDFPMSPTQPPFCGFSPAPTESSALWEADVGDRSKPTKRRLMMMM